MASKDQHDDQQGSIERITAPSAPAGTTREPTIARRRVRAGKGDATFDDGSRVTHSVGVANYVTIPLAAAVTGYSVKAIRRKIEAAVWREGREFVRAPDGHVLINIQGYHRWVAEAAE